MSYFIIGIIGFLLGYFVASKKHPSTTLETSRTGKDLISKQQEEKERNKQAIYKLLETNSPLTNNDVEKMLGISDATATRYFDELEKDGKVRQVGKTGRGVNYERI